MSAGPPGDLRRHVRRPAIPPVPVTDAFAGHAVGMLEDLTADGVALLTALPLAPETVLQLRGELPLPDGPRLAVEFGIQVVWTLPQEAGGWRSGCRLVDLPPDLADRLVAWEEEPPVPR